LVRDSLNSHRQIGGERLSKMAKRVASKSPSTNRSPSAMNRPPPAAVQNLLLAALPNGDRERLVPTLDVVALKLKDLLHKPGEHIEYVYFPGGGFLSIVTVLEDGSMVEVATIGREGAIGVMAVLDGTPVSSASMVQGESDTCYRMTADAFRREMDRRDAFYELMTRYSQALVGFIMQSTACNAVHSVEQRLARWLLMAQDRMGTDEFPLTQEFVAMMLGATRPTVTVVAGTLQKAGLITYHRGRVTVLDREKLESASCECYRVATSLLQAVTSARPRAPGTH
jgi:CRP-like cAMP-binding protein